jgi:two-component system, OmpR family, response regulator
MQSFSQNNEKSVLHASVLARIMVVDADRQLNADMCAVLQEYGYRPLPFNSPLDALIYLQDMPDEQPQLVICDLLGDGDQLDGLEFLRMSRRMNPAIPVIVATSMESNSTFEKAIIDMGADDFLLKPVRFSELLLRVRLLLRGLPGVAAWRAPELL